MKSIIGHYAFRLFAAIAVATAFAIPAAQAEPLVMKISSATVNDSNDQWMKTYAALVEKGSKGRIKVELYPGSELGSIPRTIEGTQFGSIQAVLAPPEFFSGVDTRFQVLGAPGVFKDLAHATRTFQDPEFNKAFLALGANKGLKGIGFTLSGPAVIITRVPVRKLADLAGKKIRVLASPLQMEQMRVLKATPVPMTLGDVIPAMQQGAIDGIMASTAVCTAMHCYDAAKYIFETDHAVVSVLAVISKKWYDALPPDLQKVVSDAGQTASKETYRWAIDFSNAQSRAWVKAGGVIIKPTAAEHAQLMKLMLPIGAEVTAKKPEEKALYELLQKAAKRTE